MQRMKKELSWLLVLAMVVSSILLGLGTLKVRAVSQATGQTAYYRFTVTTSAQTCAGTGTANNCTITITYSDNSTWAYTIPGESSPNYFEAGNTDNIVIGPAPAAPISNINMNSTGGDEWSTSSASFWYSYDGGTNFYQIGSMNGFDNNSPNYNFTYPSTYSLNTSSLNHTLTYNANGGTGGTSIYSEYGATLPSSNTPTVSRTGYTFTGWSPAIPSTGPSADTTYNAQWSANQYTLTFDPQGGSVSPTTSTVTYNSTYGGGTNGFPSASATGYTFQGWYTGTGGSGSNIVTGTTYTTAGNSTIYANWTINSYSITFDSQGGTAVSTITQNYNTAVTAPSNPTKTGYTFTGWSPGVPSTMPSSNTNCVAQWNANTYTLTFDAQGGSVSPGTSSVTYNGTYGGGTGGFPTPTRTGYTFAGWYTGIGGSGTHIVTGTTYATAGSSTIYAYWTANSYTCLLYTSPSPRD